MGFYSIYGLLCSQKVRRHNILYVGVDKLSFVFEEKSGVLLQRKRHAF